MKTKARIFLIGFMGSGKSTLGSALAKSLGYDYWDTDNWIEKTEGKSISDLFETKGEAYFRELEKEALAVAVQQKNVIIATGGGLPCFFDNMDVIQQFGWSVFLKINATHLLERLRGETAQRPLLSEMKEKELLEWMKYKIESRNEFYTRADIHVNGNLTINELVDLILERLK
jgi:shikimate kinase